MKKLLFLLLLWSFSIQISAMDERPPKRFKKDESSDIDSKKEKEDLSDLDKELIYVLNRNYFDLSDEDAQIAKNLLARGANPNIKNKDGSSILTRAIVFNNEKMVSLLLSSPKLSININDDGGYTVLHLATVNHNLNIINLLLKHNANINAQDNLGNTILMLVIKMESCKTHKKSDLILYLIEHNALIYIKNNIGETALDIAKKYNNKKVVELLENKIKKIKIFQEQVKQKILETTPLLPELASLTNEYLEGVY